jgi:methylenetetrahydrofolate dehydrogenase (NADP+)/methenyltetrahydrofolate cyclohydrolase
VYVGKKGLACKSMGFNHKDILLPATTSKQELLGIIRTLNSDEGINGILVQKPLPKSCDGADVFDSISAAKDVDCFSPVNVGLLTQGRPLFQPCTPSGVMHILKHYKIEISGCNALVIGRSDIVGKPMASLLLNASATVHIAHSKTKNLSELVAMSQIVVAAVGKPKILDGSLPWRKDATVIDVGINRTADGKLVGDVDFASVSKVVRAITPVPGGVGPMTIACLMENIILATERQSGDYL